MSATQVVVASGNPGKLRELRQLLGEFPLTLVPQSALGVAEAAENGYTFIENAIIKARNAASCTGCAALADDSGIVVDVLGGAPGIHSARYAGAGATDRQNLDRLLADMNDVADHVRACRFVCVIVFLRRSDDPVPIVCEGIWEGQLLRAPCGSNGFGYDPVFYVQEQACAAAELSPETKNSISHRGKAVRALAARLSLHFTRD